jgi:ribose 5-phosphate isomerase B
METIVIGSDHAGFALKEKIKRYLEKKGFRTKDVGAHSAERCDYPEFAFAVAKGISSLRYKRGVLICKSGIGNSIVANKLRGVRAALCYTIKAAELSRRHNDSNVVVLGSAFVTENVAKRIVSMWLKTPFEGGRHKRRLDQLEKIEKSIGVR